jgi:DDE superfamily endonuclease
VRLHGEAGDVQQDEVEPKMEQLRQQLESYYPENIYNMDETGLNFRALPNRTYLATGENRRDIRGSKAFAAKDRLTLVLCVNATGTSKVPPLLIGSAKEPRCFRDGRPPCPYIHQNRAWMDRTAYRFFLFDVFLPYIRETTTKKVALLMDNCAGHNPAIVDPTGQVSVFFFPPNCTSVHQPLDQEIISSFKTLYKTEVVKALVDSYTSHSLRETNEIHAGRRGVKDAFLPNILDAANFIKI